MQAVAKHVSLPSDPHKQKLGEDTDALIARVVTEVRLYSMVPDEGIACTIRRTLEAIDADIPGDLVECGTWLGGCSFAMLLAQRYAYGAIKRPVWMYDSFQGMSPPSKEDGVHADWWRKRSLSGKPDPDNQNYCSAPIEQVNKARRQFALVEEALIVPGWFHETLPKFKPDRIAVLRVDCDWYEPCKLVYEELAPRVSKGGAILIDDYYAWEGCVLATHEYLTRHRLPWMIRSTPNLCGAWMIKGPETW